MSDFSEKLELLDKEISKIIVGQENVKKEIIVALLAGGHVLLEWAPGLAKTRMVQCLSDALDLGFKRIQFTPDLLPSDLVGARIYDPEAKKFQVKKGPVFSNFVLADEINRAPSKVQSALLEAMEERQVTIGEETFPLEYPFMVLATQNPLEQEWTYELPEAQLDRFLLKVLVDYPNKTEELEVLKWSVARESCTLKKVMGIKELKAMQQSLEKVDVSESIYNYICDIVFHSRNHEMFSEILYGASPRASLALLRCSKVLAMMDGRDYVIPEDVKEITHSVMRHRIILNYEALAEGKTTDEIITRILDTTKIK